MSDSEQKPKFLRRDDVWHVMLPGDEQAYRIVDVRPPRFVVERDGERRTFFFAPDSRPDARTRGATWVGHEGHSRSVEPLRRRGAGDADAGAGSGELTAPMPGRVLEVLVREGDAVATGDRLVVVEAMKMEQPLRAPHHGVVSKLHVEVGQMLDAGDSVIVVEAQTD